MLTPSQFQLITIMLTPSQFQLITLAWGLGILCWGLGILCGFWAGVPVGYRWAIRTVQRVQRGGRR